MHRTLLSLPLLAALILGGCDGGNTTAPEPENQAPHTYSVRADVETNDTLRSFAIMAAANTQVQQPGTDDITILTEGLPYERFLGGRTAFSGFGHVFFGDYVMEARASIKLTDTATAAWSFGNIGCAYMAFVEFNPGYSEIRYSQASNCEENTDGILQMGGSIPHQLSYTDVYFFGLRSLSPSGQEGGWRYLTNDGIDIQVMDFLGNQRQENITTPRTNLSFRDEGPQYTRSGAANMNMIASTTNLREVVLADFRKRHGLN